jgi:putative cell wall-binding protein
VFGAIAGVTAFGTLSGLAVQAASAAPTGNNMAGADRYATAGNLNAAKFPTGVGTVLLADAIPGTPGSGAGGHQSDALAVSGYAGLNKYGLLLTDNTNTVPANTMSALASLKVKNIIAVGGSASVSPAQVTQLTGAGYTVTQPFAGADRYATMQMVDNSFTPATVGKDPSGNPTAILASGDYAHLVDALASGGLAYAKKFPVILTPTGSSTLGSQAQSEITNLGIKHLIVVGGTASIPASQYTPNPSGVTTVDVFSGADRSATSRALEKAEVATYGATTTKLAVAAGATNVGSTTQTQNDGADALSAAPYNGDFEALCVTNSPSDAGSAPACVSDVNPTTVDFQTGPANLPASQQSTILAGGTTTSPNGYTVSGGSLTASASSAAAPATGATTYTVSGLPTAAGTVANIALFPCAGTSQTGNGPTNGTPQTKSGSTTFTAPGGTSPAAGTAVGQGTSSSNSPAAVANWSAGSVSGATSTAYIASVNGVPTSTRAAAPNDNGPTQVFGVSPNNGNLTFVVNSFNLDCVIPVVYTAPSSAGTTPPLLVNANGTPQTGYTVGAGGPTAWSAQNAPATPAANPYEVSVALAPPLSGTSSFDGAVVTCTAGVFAAPGAAAPGCPAGVNVGSIYSFNFGTSGSSYNYTDNTPLSMTNFATYLSGAVVGEQIPNSTTIFQPAANGGKGGVNGDGVTVGTGTGYSNGAPANFAYLPAIGGDVPAAATSLNGSYNGGAFTAGGLSQPGVVLTWTPPANPDVSGSQAVPGGVTLAGNASYQIWRSTVSGGTTSAATQIGAVTVSSSTTVNNGDGQVAAGCNASAAACTNVTSPEFIDTTFASGQQYVYYVVPQAAGASGGGLGPFSAGSSTVTAGSAATAPTITAVQIVPGQALCGGVACTPNQSGAGTPPTFPAGEGVAIVTYSSAVSCNASAGADFVYSNSGGANGSGSHAVTATSCASAKNGANEYDTNTGAYGAPAAVCAATAGACEYNGATTDNSANTLIITFPAFASTFSGGTTFYNAVNIVAPANGDTFTYTAPSSPTTSTAVFAGTVGSPAYQASGTTTSNGTDGAADPTTPQAGAGQHTGNSNADPAAVGNAGVAGTDPLYF